MRILVITREFPPHVVGGLSYHLGNLYTEIANRGHNITVLAGVCREAEDRADHLVDSAIDVRPVRYGSFHGHHLSYPLAAAWALRDIDSSRYDIAFTHTQLPYTLSLPTIAKYHDCPQAERPYFRRDFSLPIKIADSLIDPTRRIVERRSFTTADYAIFNSHRCKRAWRKHYEFGTPSTVIHNGINREIFYPREPTHNEQYVLFVGDSERKGLTTVREFAKISSQSIYIVGESDISAPNVRTLGRVSQDQLATLYSDASVTIHPAQFEAFGNIVLESLSCGTPVVTTTDCGASELLTEETGVVTDNSATQVATGVEHARGLNRADCVALAREHTWARVATATLKLAEKIVT